MSAERVLGYMSKTAKFDADDEVPGEGRGTCTKSITMHPFIAKSCEHVPSSTG